MSERVERRLYDLLERPTESPYGNPIPGLEGLGGQSSGSFSDGVINLVEAMPRYSPDSKVVVCRLSEPIQVEPELLGQLDDGGIHPGVEITLEQSGEYIAVRVSGIEGALELPPEVATHVFVSMS